MSDNNQSFFGKLLGGSGNKTDNESPQSGNAAPKSPTPGGPTQPPRPPVSPPVSPKPPAINPGIPRPPSSPQSSSNITKPNSSIIPPPAKPTTQDTSTNSGTVGIQSPNISAISRSGVDLLKAASRGQAILNGEEEGAEYSINDLLKLVVEKDGSDLHLTVGAPPMMRLKGRLWPTDLPPLTPKDTRRLIFEFLTNEQRERFERDMELDISYEIPQVSRFRCNVFMNRLGMGAVFRVIPTRIKTLEELKMPYILTELARRTKGLVLVTGPTGSGKSTTLAAMVNLINTERQDHILTIEDPIEFVHTHKQSIVNQRELGTNTKSFANALRAALREDPDVILVGEMRDYETIALAVTAAETGHLVFATLHTPSAPQSVERIVDVFPAHQQAQIRTQLADALVGIIAQQLIPTADGSGRVVALEILVNVPAVANLIRENKTFQLHSIMQTSKQLGMQTMDQSLTDLVKQRKISPEEAYRRAFDKKAFEQYKPR